MDAKNIIEDVRNYLDGWEHVHENVKWEEGMLGHDVQARTGMFLGGLVDMVEEKYRQFEEEEDAARRLKQQGST